MVAKFVCDFPLTGGGRKTCDRKLCDRHAKIQPGKLGAAGGNVCHYCPAHDRIAKGAS